MANIMMPPISKSLSPAQAPEQKGQIEPDREASFSNYMDKKIRTEQREKRAMLGVQEKTAPQKTTRAPEPAKAESVQPEETEATYLQGLMAELQKMLADDTNSKAGEWTLEGSDMLDKLAAFAGMDDAELALLKKQMAEQGSLGLTDLFAALEKHFSMLNTDLQVTVPETNVAFLETLLAKMGISAEQVSALSDKAVNGLSELDLIAYLKGVEQLAGENKQGVTLSSWELEQLQSMLSQAGMTEESLHDLFPEANALLRKSLEALGLATADADVQLSVERLKNLLEQAIADADTAKAKANVPGFLDELKGMLSQAGFEGKDVGWTPVVQESMSTVYRELQKMVDLAKVKIEKVTETRTIEEGLASDWLNSGKKVVIEGAEKSQMNLSDFTPSSSDQAVEEELLPSSLQNTDGNQSKSFISHLGTQEAQPVPEQQTTLTEPRVPLTRVRLAPEMQQFAMDQISQGVMRGLRNNLHQLTLTMYPKELGEVKVDMQIRESHISVSFVMQNSRVKEALESTMQDFKDNLNRQGFSLQDCFVSVDQQNNSDDARQRFEEAWERLVAQTGHEKDGGLPNETMGTVGERYVQMNQGGTISLFV
nr:flagellar hook-length control protein FliK [Desulfobulbaceae bacterium]